MAKILTTAYRHNIHALGQYHPQHHLHHASHHQPAYSAKLSTPPRPFPFIRSPPTPPRPSLHQTTPTTVLITHSWLCSVWQNHCFHFLISLGKRCYAIFNPFLLECKIHPVPLHYNIFRKFILRASIRWEPYLAVITHRQM